MACAEACAGELEPVRTSSFLEHMRRRLRSIRRCLSPYVTIDPNVIIEENYIIRVEEVPVEIAVETNEEPTENACAYMSISDSSRIIRASWHQGQNFPVIQITFDEEPSIYGNLNDKLNEANFGSTLRQGLEDLFMVHNAGILITGGQSFGVMHYSCGQKGSRANDNNGKACVIECDNFDEFVRICKRTTGSKNVQYTLDYIDVEVLDIHDDSEAETQQSAERATAASQSITSQQNLTYQTIPLQTTMMAPIDVMPPNVEDQL
ncbi:hypothetical protein J6590_025814 [Homalodisca vitripennis]|nr:hypothetical protein J6590_025814 [Homalodisca vitripennis]